MLKCAEVVVNRLGGKVTSVLIGSAEVEELSHEIARRGANKVLVFISDKFETYPFDVTYNVLCSVLTRYKIDFFFLGHTPFSMQFAPRLATKLNIGLISCCTGLKIEDGELVFLREICNGKLYANITLKPPGIISFLPGSFPEAEEKDRSGEIVKEFINVNEYDLKVKLIGEETLSEEVDLSMSKVIVAGGRGLKDRESFDNIIKRLAKCLDAEYAGSRPAKDYGWVPTERVIGVSGKSVKPQLYLAIGISGAIQHMSGVRGSKCIIAINKDQNAPIFRYAHYGIVGDLFKIVPALLQELEKCRKKAS
jgi:electron transfer flavoprotein alpha subunit